MAEVANRITGVTRRKLFYTARSFYGFLDPDEELKLIGMVWNLDTLPSYDTRYPTFTGDLYQHRANNNDWDDDWIFTDDRFRLSDGDDKTLLAFLAALVHPEIEIDLASQAGAVDAFNEDLRRDGYELVEVSNISGHPIYEGRVIGGFQDEAVGRVLDKFALLGNPNVLLDHFKVIERSIGTDPAQAIASAKELVETTMRVILDRSAIAYRSGDDLPTLYKKVAELLNLQAEAVPESIAASSTTRGILRNLVATVQSLAELRNEIGRGHGRNRLSPAYERHARLALNASVTVAEFLIETWRDRVNTGKLVLPDA